MAENLGIIIKSLELLDLNDLLDIVKKKFCEQTSKSKFFKESNDILLKENEELRSEIKNLKKDYEKSTQQTTNDYISKNINFEETCKIKTEIQEISDEDDFKNVIEETFCSETDDTQYSMVESTFCDTNIVISDKTSPIICSKYKKNRNKVTTPIKKQYTNSQLPQGQCSETFWNDSNCVPETPDAYISKISFKNISNVTERLPLVSTENSPKSSLKNTDFTKKSPALFDSSEDSEKKEVKRVGTWETIEKRRSNKLKKSSTKNTKLKQISVIKCFKKSVQSSPENVFNFEHSDALNENVTTDMSLNESKIFIKPCKKEPISKHAEIDRVRKKLKYSSSEEEIDEKYVGQPQKDSATKKQESSFLFIRDAVRKKSERKKLQGWACEECKKYYETAKLTDSQLQAKINECSRHRDNRNPFETNTPPGYWNPEFPPTQEINRTQTEHKISSK